MSSTFWKYFAAGFFAAVPAVFVFGILYWMEGFVWMHLLLSVIIFGFGVDVCLRGSDREGAHSAEGGSE